MKMKLSATSSSPVQLLYGLCARGLSIYNLQSASLETLANGE